MHFIHLGDYPLREIPTERPLLLAVSILEFGIAAAKRQARRLD